MKVIFYVAATCGNIDFHFIANLEASVCNHFLADYTVSVSVSLTRGTATGLREEEKNNNNKHTGRVLKPLE